MNDPYRFDVDIAPNQRVLVRPQLVPAHTGLWEIYLSWHEGSTWHMTTWPEKFPSPTAARVYVEGHREILLAAIRDEKPFSPDPPDPLEKRP